MDLRSPDFSDSGDLASKKQEEKGGYFEMAYLGETIGKLGFGLMRLPQKEDGTIDVEQT